MLHFLLSVVVAFTMIACGGAGNGRGVVGLPGYDDLRLDRNNYRFRDHIDFHHFNNQRFNYNWNQYENQWLSQQGHNDIAFCGLPYIGFDGLCYQSCQQRQWTSFTGFQTGLVWQCDLFFGCGWYTVAQAQPWFSFHWVPYVQPAVCF